MARNGYTGWRVPDPPGPIEVLDAANVDSQRLWADYISKRKPVLLRGTLTDPGWKAGEKWTNAYLAQHAGACKLDVEVRKDASAGFGKGIKQPMTFKDFLTRVDEGDESLYLTTQKVASAADGHPALYGCPLTALTKDFPLQPQLMGRLVPQQMNLWMGCAKSGSSSGLHHDFHDNLYVLLRGRKRFRLWDPSQAPHMPTVGQLTQVHPNGRIVYQGQEDVLADGSSARESAAWEARSKAEARVARAEQAVRDNVPGAAEQLSSAEEALEQLLEEHLEAAIGGDAGDELEGDMMQDDYVDSDEDLSSDSGSDADGAEGASEDFTDSDGDSDPAQPPSTQPGGVRRALGVQPTKQGKAKKGGKGDAASSKEDAQPQPDSADPPSFCPGVDLSQSDAAIRKKFKSFPGTGRMMEVWVEAGQMLYLPAGWFHEVTSFSPDTQPGAATPATASQGATGTRSRQRKEHAQVSASAPVTCHMAFNYWFHPPDGNAFDKPYKSDYWPSLWRARCESLGVKPAGAHSPQDHSQQPLHPVLIRRSSFETVKVDELDGATGHDPHRGPRHSFEGVRVDEIDGGTGHDPHRGAQHQFEGVKVDEKDGATGHDPHRGPRHSFDGVKVDEVDGATGHDPHRGPRHSFDGVKVDEVDGAMGHDPHRGPRHSFDGVKVDEVDGATGHDPHRRQHHHFEGVRVDEAQGGTGHHPPGRAGTASPGEAAGGVTVVVETEGGGGGGGRKSSRKGAPKRLTSSDPHPTRTRDEEAAAGVAAKADSDEGKGQAAADAEPAEHSGGKRKQADSNTSDPALQQQQPGSAKRKAKKTKADSGKPGAGAPRDDDVDMEEGEEGGDDDGGLMEGDEGELGEMVAKELGEYFQSEEGSGAFRLALREYLLKALAEGGFGNEGQQHHRRSARSRGRRHHRVVRVPRQ